MTVHLVTGHSGEVHVTSAEQGALNAYLWGMDSYRLSGAAITIVDDNTVHIGGGTLLIEGRHVNLNDDGDDVSIESGVTGKYRRDLICLRYEMSTQTGVEKASWEVVRGTDGDSYVTPTVDDTSILKGDNPAQIPCFTVDMNNLMKIVAVDTLLGDFITYDTANEKLRETTEACEAELEDKVSDIESTVDGYKESIEAVGTTTTETIAAKQAEALAAIAAAWDGDSVAF